LCRALGNSPAVDAMHDHRVHEAPPRVSSVIAQCGDRW
jgi:hypothetical protein